MREASYENLKGISQSTLKLLDYSPKYFHDKEYTWLTSDAVKPKEVKPESMRLGELVDCLILTPNTFDTQFVLNAETPPTGQMLTFVESLYNLEVEATKGFTEPITAAGLQSLANQAYGVAGFKRDSFNKVMERFEAEALGYYKLLKSAYGKAIITPELLGRAHEIIEELKAHELIRPILWPTEERIEIKTQLAISSDRVAPKGFKWPVKGLLDLVVINHQRKTIRGYDLKTSAEESFPRVYATRRYDIQASLYHALLSEWVIQNKDKYGGYTVENFAFIVASTTGGQHGVWFTDDDLLTSGMLGGTSIFGRPIKGWYELMKDLMWHEATGKWEFTREEYESGGRQLRDAITHQHYVR